MLASSIVCWQSHLQKTVALSSTEAEYMALSDTCRQISWIQSLFGELRYTLTHIPICSDNQGSIFIRSNPVQERCTKHIDIRYHYIHECIENDKVMVIFIPGNNNLADTLELSHERRMRVSTKRRLCSNVHVYVWVSMYNLGI
jgi:hypothetical protein